MARDGMEKATTKAVAAEAKLNEAYIYKCFSNKDELLSAALHMEDVRFANLLQKTLPVMHMPDLLWKERAYILWKRSWDFILQRPEDCAFYPRYYYSASYRAHAYERHLACFKPLIEKVSKSFKPGTNMDMLVHQIFFTMGNVKITLDETDVNNPEGDRVTSNAYEVYPGAVVTKDPIVHNVGNNGAYIRATVNVSNWMNLVAAYYPDFKETFPNDGYKAALNLLVGELGEGWSVVDVVAGDTFTIGQFDAKFILKYDGVLAADADTTAMFQTVTIPAGIDNANAESFDSVKVVAQAIQADGFVTWEAAFAAFDAE